MAVGFYLEKRTDKNGDSPIRVSICIQGKRFVTNTGLKISQSKWNSARQQVKQGCSNAAGITYSVINKKLLQISEHFVALENRCINEDLVIDAKNLKAELIRVVGREKSPNDAKIAKGFYGIYDLFMVETGKKNLWTMATHQKFRALKKHLQEWRPRLDFENFDEKGLVDFVWYLQNKCGMRNSTVGKQLGFLKWFLRWADYSGYNTERAYLAFKPRLRQAAKKIVFLDWGELMRVYRYEIPDNGTSVHLTNADGVAYERMMEDASAIRKSRDIFCFCCFTGLRYSDAVNLRRSDIGKGSIVLTTIKTADTITIELNKYAQSILDKYKDVALPDGKALPQISNQQMNKHLKTLCEFCGINQPVTQTYFYGNVRSDETLPKYELVGTHTGRRTFICNALMLGISPQIVMQWTGHSDYKSMKPYIAITDAAKAEAMTLFDKI